MTYAKGLLDERDRVLKAIQRIRDRLERDRGYNWRKAFDDLAGEVWQGAQEIPFEEPVVVGQ